MRRLRWVILYVVLLVASHVVQSLRADAARERAARDGGTQTQSVLIAPTTDQGAIDAPPIRFAIHDWPAQGPASDRPPIILLHGSPGDGHDFATLAGLLTAGGYRVIAPDLPGFGKSEHRPPSYSTRAHAYALLQLLDQLHIDRFHVVGWSMGGGVALQTIDLLDQEQRGDRVASLTLLASVGTQRNEGSGSYRFEHAKYAVGMALLAYGGELIPHFGLLGTFDFRHSFLRNFGDTDFRLNDPVIARLSTPTLVLHGRNDVLIPARAAVDHHRQIASSRMVMLDANHFIPLMQADQAAVAILPFVERHDRPGVVPVTGMIDHSHPPAGAERLMSVFENLAWRAGWWWEVAFIAGLMLLSPTLAVAICALLIDAMHVDFFVALVGVMVGWLAQSVAAFFAGLGARLGTSDIVDVSGRRLSRSDWNLRFDRGVMMHAWTSQFVPVQRRELPAAVGLLGRGFASMLIARPLAALAWTLVALIPAVILFPMLVEPVRAAFGLLGVLVLVKLVSSISGIAPMLCVRRGRQEIRRAIDRIRHHEYWPAAIFYIPIVPLLYPLVRSLGGISKSLTLPTAVNPAIENAGGLVGESKYTIMQELERAADRTGLRELVCPTGLLIRQSSIDEDLRELAAHMSRMGLRFPVILKPESGYRGFGVKLVRSEEAARVHLQALGGNVLVQPFVPGPEEIGIVWSRSIPPREPGRIGFIFSITAKEFPKLVGDGVRTIEELLWSHPRFRRQATTFEQRLVDRRSWIPAAGEIVPLGVAGNHCQGTLFRDGDHLRSPALEAALDRLLGAYAPSFPGGGVDIGRFDLRFSDPAQLAEGRGFSIIEFNGIFGESTNIYDPDRSLFWAYGVLRRQWELLFTLGAWRAAQGAPRLSFWQVMAMVRRNYAQRRGPEISD
jgi:pimeloyl-ACP methyl ester carboxylesterase